MTTKVFCDVCKEEWIARQQIFGGYVHIGEMGHSPLLKYEVAYEMDSEFGPTDVCPSCAMHLIGKQLHP